MPDQSNTDGGAASSAKTADQQTDKPQDKNTLAANPPQADAKPADQNTLTPKAEEKPIEYKEFKLPEGVKLEGDTLKQMTDLFTDGKLSQEQAQKLVDFHYAHTKSMQDELDKSLAADRKQWREEIQKLPESAKLVQDAQRALDFAFGKEPSEDRQFFTVGWLGDHPAVIKMLGRLGALVREDGDHSQHVQTKPAEKTLTERLYPTMNQKG